MLWDCRKYDASSKAGVCGGGVRGKQKSILAGFTRIMLFILFLRRMLLCAWRLNLDRGKTQGLMALACGIGYGYGGGLE